MSFEKAFNIVSELVKDFKENEKSFLSQGYLEAQLRNDFLNKFFFTFGLDTNKFLNYFYPKSTPIKILFQIDVENSLKNMENVLSEYN